MTEDQVAARLREIAAAHQDLEGPLLPILHEVQAEFGHIPAQAPEILADCLNLGRAEVHGVISFYHDFRSAPVEGQHLRLCRAEACQSMGSEALAAELSARLGAWGQVDASRHQAPSGHAPGDQHHFGQAKVTLEPVYCLGLCACAPAAEVNGRLIGRASAEKILALIGGQA